MSGTSNGDQGPPEPSMPYQESQEHSGVANFKIVDGTLREGELRANDVFDIEAKTKIAKALDEFGVDYLEVTNPSTSTQAFEDCKTLSGLGLKAKILTRVPCNMEDAKVAVSSGVAAVDLVIGTFRMPFIQKTALEVIEYVKSQGVEVRFSTEDSFRSDLADIVSLYRAVDAAGVDTVGVADTVGSATPRSVYDFVQTIRGVVSCSIEARFYDDIGCAVGNALTALEAGATQIGTSVLGIAERNGVASLGAFGARMIVQSPDYVKGKYNIKKLLEIETLVSETVQVSIPFNNPVTGFCAFNHKAGVHAKAILKNPSTYESVSPEDWGLSRNVQFASRLTGWNAIKSRVEQLGLQMPDDDVKKLTVKIKELADTRPLTTADTDELIHSYHAGLQKS